MGRTPEQWDRLYSALDLAVAGDELPDYLGNDECKDCGSMFRPHRCHMEEDR